MSVYYEYVNHEFESFTIFCFLKNIKTFFVSNIVTFKNYKLMNLFYFIVLLFTIIFTGVYTTFIYFQSKRKD